jgi:hypothetical protein
MRWEDFKNRRQSGPTDCAFACQFEFNQTKGRRERKKERKKERERETRLFKTPMKMICEHVKAGTFVTYHINVMGKRIQCVARTGTAQNDMGTGKINYNTTGIYMF